MKIIDINSILLETDKIVRTAIEKYMVVMERNSSTIVGIGSSNGGLEAMEIFF